MRTTKLEKTRLGVRGDGLSEVLVATTGKLPDEASLGSSLRRSPWQPCSSHALKLSRITS